MQVLLLHIYGMQLAVYNSGGCGELLEGFADYVWLSKKHLKVDMVEEWRLKIFAKARLKVLSCF